MRKKFEVCCFNAISALNAQKAGADRIELCENYQDGGTTPSYGTMEFVRNNVEIDLFVMIRPRGGDFYYSFDEVEIMRKDIRVAREIGVDGFVLGALKRDGSLDIRALKCLIEETVPLPITFHRAFDIVPDPFIAAENLIDLEFDRILTSGQKKTAFEGKELIKELIKRVEDKIIILPGSGINSLNIKEISDYTGADEFHFSAKRFISSESDVLGISGKKIIADEEIIKETMRQVL